jgi:hypothetical protein
MSPPINPSKPRHAAALHTLYSYNTPLPLTKEHRLFNTRYSNRAKEYAHAFYIIDTKKKPYIPTSIKNLTAAQNNTTLIKPSLKSLTTPLSPKCLPVHLLNVYHQKTLDLNIPPSVYNKASAIFCTPIITALMTFTLYPSTGALAIKQGKNCSLIDALDILKKQPNGIWSGAYSYYKALTISRFWGIGSALMLADKNSSSMHKNISYGLAAIFETWLTNHSITLSRIKASIKDSTIDKTHLKKSSQAAWLTHYAKNHITIMLAIHANNNLPDAVKESSPFNNNVTQSLFTAAIIGSAQMLGLGFMDQWMTKRVISTYQNNGTKIPASEVLRTFSSMPSNDSFRLSEALSSALINVFKTSTIRSCLFFSNYFIFFYCSNWVMNSFPAKTSNISVESAPDEVKQSNQKSTVVSATALNNTSRALTTPTNANVTTDDQTHHGPHLPRN